MKENQYTEFKESWHDEYVRYISAFCNTDGGTLYIGRGTQRIIDKCVEDGLSAPVYEYKMGFLYLIFINERINERINELSGIEQTVYLLLKENPQLRQSDLAVGLDLTEQYIRKIMRVLKEKGWIERVGARKKGYWKVIDKQ